jgi:hypothetical protein
MTITAFFIFVPSLLVSEKTTVFFEHSICDILIRWVATVTPISTVTAIIASRSFQFKQSRAEMTLNIAVTHEGPRDKGFYRPISEKFFRAQKHLLLSFAGSATRWKKGAQITSSL